jgi:hypothetical protein
MSDHSTFLFAVPTWAEGVGRLVDFGGFLNEYNSSSSEDEADLKAMTHDWEAVGSDLRKAMRKFGGTQDLATVD